VLEHRDRNSIAGTCKIPRPIANRRAMPPEKNDTTHFRRPSSPPRVKTCFDQRAYLSSGKVAQNGIEAGVLFGRGVVVKRPLTGDKTEARRLVAFGWWRTSNSPTVATPDVVRASTQKQVEHGALFRWAGECDTRGLAHLE
jgi:hypothetical protein